MPAKDVFNEAVRNALIKDGWAITADPYKLRWKGRRLYVDLAAERVLAAEKGGRKIAVEIKSFVGKSEMNDFEKAIGQYGFYRAIMAEQEPDRELYLAVPDEVFQELFQKELKELLLKYNLANVFGFDTEKEVITGWIQ